MRERPGFRNRALLDFVCAVAAVQEAPEIPLGRAAGLDRYGLDIAVGMALRQGFIHPVAPGRYIVTRQGLAASLSKPALCWRWKRARCGRIGRGRK